MNLTTKAQIAIEAPLGEVWNALINPEIISKYMLDTTVVSNWQQGGDIKWKGQWKGKAYEDKGKIVQIVPQKLLQYTHFSPLTGKADAPENYHTVTIELESKNHQTLVSLSQNNNRTEEEKEHSEKNWQMMLEQMKKIVEEELP